MNKFDKTLAAEIQRLPKVKTPERDLWRGIELSLHTQAPKDEARGSGARESNLSSTRSSKVVHLSEKSLFTVARALAASALLVCFIWFFAPGFINGNIDNEGADLAGTALVEALSLQQDEQMSALLASYDSVPELSENWQVQLKELDDAAGVIKAALQDDPNNRALLKMLQHVYQQQIALIERVHAPKWQQI